MTTHDDTHDEHEPRRQSPSPSPDGGVTPASGSDNAANPGGGGLLDIAAVFLLTCVTALALVVPVTPRPLVWLLGVPFVLFYPGYVWVVAVFPEATDTVDAAGVRPRGPPSTAARVALSLVVSTILVAVVAALLSPAAAIELVPVVGGIVGVTLVGALLAVGRRRRLPAHRRGGVAGLSDVPALGLPGTRGQNVLTVVAFLVLLAVVGAALLVPPPGDAYSEAYLLTEDDDSFVVDNLPETVAPGEQAQFHVGVENHENERVSYDVVTVVQGLDGDGSVTTQRETDQRVLTLEDGEQAIEPQTFTVEDDGDQYRLQVLVYEGDRPADPSADTADHVLQFRVTAEE